VPPPLFSGLGTGIGSVRHPHPYLPTLPSNVNKKVNTNSYQEKITTYNWNTYPKKSTLQI
jgi:hypothetical protein